ncbi:2-dehydropantoate 2-reductase [Amycolatopsis pretoriensis]|uniref:2-dehydropantoate 2-reductase n=1 Tax=Amycolatopsis pretoriensis TaxID=218821 RepID=A0A1H5QAY6_9PSEU|nr:2-dehydropantoate 2-reductase [Amycolatopsis pretoriensis]SEF23272.1 2-dehydropantoate 2-reductase [Amycolatopsis pretoriensis]
MSDVKILVVGAGATGGYFGGRLLQAGRDVTFLVRPARAKLLRERGLRIVGLGEETTLDAPLVETGSLDRAYDLVLLAVKATGLASAIDDFAPAVGPGTLILPFLNGLAHIDALDKRFGADTVLGGVAKVQTTVDDDGAIRRLGPLQSLAYGARAEAPEKLADVHAALNDAGFSATLDERITESMWAKWVFIAAIGAVNSLMRGTIGDVVAVPGGAEFAEAVVAEAAAVAAAAGYPVPAADLAATRKTVTDPAMGGSSLYRDLLGGHPVEGEQIFGDLTARARELGVATPLLDLVTLQLRVHQHRIG